MTPSPGPAASVPDGEENRSGDKPARTATSSPPTLFSFTKAGTGGPRAGTVEKGGGRGKGARGGSGIRIWGQQKRGLEQGGILEQELGPGQGQGQMLTQESALLLGQKAAHQRCRPPVLKPEPATGPGPDLTQDQVLC
ncbi:hypothetical protein AAFF_G00088900 [Aldrovandia affinis]|uniref:Uncharacterized protein n=1 Tax=Aldrovandia affinis TaxID=143900 RepID=A0AAD7R1X9_9TELE|nr:hypothetical protein AAFF_G00088900 [Aldrovandia affinis]